MSPAFSRAVVRLMIRRASQEITSRLSPFLGVERRRELLRCFPPPSLLEELADTTGVRAREGDSDAGEPRSPPQLLERARVVRHRSSRLVLVDEDVQVLAALGHGGEDPPAHAERRLLEVRLLGGLWEREG